MLRNVIAYKIDDDTDIWYPQIYIGKSVESQNLISFDKDSKAVHALYLYYSARNHQIEYATIVTITISCSMRFQSFPFDSHECSLDLKNWNGAANKIVLNSPKLLRNDEYGNEILGEELIIDSDGRLEYDFYFKGPFITDISFFKGKNPH